MAAPAETVAQFAVLVVLADLSDDAGECYPSQATIARRTHLAERHVRRVLHELADLGLAHVSRPPTGKSSATYQLTLQHRTFSPDKQTGVDIQPGQSTPLERTNSHASPDNMSAHPLKTPKNPQNAPARVTPERAREALGSGRPNGNGTERHIAPPANLHDNSPRFPLPSRNGGVATGKTESILAAPPGDAEARALAEIRGAHGASGPKDPPPRT